MQNQGMKLQQAAPPPPTFLGMETSSWTVIIAALTVVVAAFAGWVAWRSSKRSVEGQHHQWLLEKQREAYVTFLTATRDLYDAIEELGKHAEAPRDTQDHQDPESDDLVRVRKVIDEGFGKVKRAKDNLSIVGPKEMEDLGDRVIARLNLDRIYYSPRGSSQRAKDKDRILRYAEATGNKDFLAAMRRAYTDGHADFAEYRTAHHDYRLDDFWNDFKESARRVLGNPKPNQKT